MNTTVHRKIPAWFWVVAVLAILWNLAGVASYVSDVTMSKQALAAMPEARRALYEAQPGWLTGVYAIAVFVSLAGALALALRRKIATPLFAAGLVAIVAQFGYVFGAMKALSVVGASSAILPGAIIVIAAALVWFSMQARTKGWLR